MNTPRSLLAKTLNMPRAKRAHAFVENERKAGRLGLSNAEMHSQLMRFTEQEDILGFTVDNSNCELMLEAAGHLMDGDPLRSTWQGVLLIELVKAIQIYEGENGE